MRQRSITCVDEFDDIWESARMAFLVLQPDHVRCELTQLDLGRLVVEVADNSFPYVSRGQSVEGRVSFTTPLRTMAPAKVNGEAFTPGMLIAGGGSTEVVGDVAGPLRAALVSFAEGALDDYAIKTGLELDLPGRGEAREVRTREWVQLRDLIQDVMSLGREPDHGARSDEAAHSLENALIEFCLHTFAADQARPGLLPHARLNSMRIVRACEDYAAHERHRSVTLADLCAASGATERRVRHAFSDCFGMSPTGYLRVAALYEVHKELMAGFPVPDPVSRAASEFGFWHLGRFAAQYRALFGEPPHETARRAQGTRRVARRAEA